MKEYRVRFRLQDWNRIRRTFKAESKETIASYLHRLSLWIKELKKETENNGSG